jgi:hypothetical protein
VRKKQSGLLAEEQRIEGNGFGQGHADDGLDKDLAGGAGIAAHGFNSLGANEPYAKGGAQTAECALDATCDVSENVHDTMVLFGWNSAVRALRHAPDGKVF